MATCAYRRREARGHVFPTKLLFLRGTVGREICTWWKHGNVYEALFYCLLLFLFRDISSSYFYGWIGWKATEHKKGNMKEEHKKTLLLLSPLLYSHRLWICALPYICMRPACSHVRSFSPFFFFVDCCNTWFRWPGRPKRVQYLRSCLMSPQAWPTTLWEK